MTEEFEDQGFAALMSDQSDVKPIRLEKRASDQQAKDIKSLAPDQKKQAQRQAALGEAITNIDFLRSLTPESYDPQDIMGFKHLGLQEGVYKKLRTGKYEIQAKLDLHGLTVQESLDAVLKFIHTSMESQRRCVLISHGKGIKRENPGRLKNYLAAWLKHLPEVMAYHSAGPQHGGAGCVYILLRKSDEKRQENRDRFAHAKT